MTPRRQAALWAIGLGGILGLAVFLPDARYLPACPFHHFTGWPCATCGLSRAFIALGHGHWSEAFALHPASPLFFAGALPLAGLVLVQLATGRPLLSRLWASNRAWLVPGLILILGGAWLYRFLKG